MVLAFVAISVLFKSDVLAGPKGDIIVRYLGDENITIDGSISDWPLDKFKKVARRLRNSRTFRQHRNRTVRMRVVTTSFLTVTA
ncbi:MAG: hypothetical protein DSZ35_08925 [Verrucomicrobia bacterium]|nr:MAG: hypothetical protein DSZ35_08925 [Verrucomicrobiota bacterium]